MLGIRRLPLARPLCQQCYSGSNAHLYKFLSAYPRTEQPDSKPDVARISARKATFLLTSLVDELSAKQEAEVLHSQALPQGLQYPLADGRICYYDSETKATWA